MNKVEAGMNVVVVNSQGVSLPSWSDSIITFALKVLNEIQQDNWELSILVCDDNTIQELNSQYRNKNEATDILSFSLGETIQDGEKTVYLAGDLVISLDTLRKNADYFEISEDEELRRLLIHGILHLNGMEHSNIKQNEYEQSSMLMLQEEILNRLKNEHIIPKLSGGGDK